VTRLYPIRYLHDEEGYVSALMHAGIVNAGAFIANRFAFVWFKKDKIGYYLEII